MNALSLIIQREYTIRVRKKSFIILTLLMPVLMVSLTFLPLWLSTLNDGDIKRIAVIDYSGIYAPLLPSNEIFQFEVVGEEQRANTETKVGKELFAILQITGDLSNDQGTVSLTSEKQSPQELQSLIRQTLQEKVTQQRLDQLSASGEVESESIARCGRYSRADLPSLSRPYVWTVTAVSPSHLPRWPPSSGWCSPS